MNASGKFPSAKVMLLGDIAVGKTSLAKRIVFDKFDTDYKTTIGVNVLTHEVKLDAQGAESLRLVIWDTDGDFSQAIFNTAYVAGASGAIIVGDASRIATVEKMAGLVEAFEAQFPGRPIAAVLNKTDIAASGVDFVRKAGLRLHPLVRTSALTGDGVADMFMQMARAIRRRGL